MVQGGSTITAVAASLSWVALVLLGLVRAAGAEPPAAFETFAALVAAPVALAGGAQAVAAVWRGPTIVAFGRADAVPCSPSEAAFVRAHAQLRGTMGGAGHLYRPRLAWPALAWFGGAAIGPCALSGSVGRAVVAWPVGVALVAGLVAILFPARAYFYRDTTGGGALVSPPSAAYRLKRRSVIAAALARGEQVEATTPPPLGAPVAAPQAQPPDAGA